MQTLAAIDALVAARRGGVVFTPNVDHVVVAERNEPFRRAYADADLTLADGMPLVWLARLLGQPLPERVAGSDLFSPLMRTAASRKWRVYLVGAAPSVAERAVSILTERFGVDLIGWHSPVISPDGREAHDDSIERLRINHPDVVIVALGTPKQELWIARARKVLPRITFVGVGASIDFLVGAQRRAPRWIARAGMEWAYRLCREPRRLWRRYLLQDSGFLLIALRTWRDARISSSSVTRAV
jgi:N-acetylglucosaminyldiphosphoundecaprenol N-acetyl-beta-D-mannosaminyltransferase